MEPGQNTNIVMLGSRGRPELAQKCLESFKAKSHISDFLLIIDEDEQDLYPRIEGVTTVVMPASYGTTWCAKTNYFVEKQLYKGYFTFSWVDDDCVVETDGWDLLLSLPLKVKGYGVAWGNDGIQHGRVPTKGTATTNLLDIFGFFSIPGTIHLYVDDFWKRIGEELNSAHYAPNVMIPHYHWVNKKAEVDKTYEISMAQETWEHDRRVFMDYTSGDFHDVIAEAKKILKIS
jgi:hypothetical protein